MKKTHENTTEQQASRAAWQPPVVREYDATREIKGETLLGGDVLITGGS